MVLVLWLPCTGIYYFVFEYYIDYYIFVNYFNSRCVFVSSFVGRQTQTEFSLARMQSVVDVFNRLEARRRCSNEEFTAALSLRAVKYGKVRDLITLRVNA